MRGRKIICVVLLPILLWMTPSGCWPDDEEASITADDVLRSDHGRKDTRLRAVVKFRPGIDEDRRAALHVVCRHKLTKVIPQLDMHFIRIPPGKTYDEALARYRNHPFVEFAEAELFMEPQIAPNDAWYANWQLDIQQLGIEEAWDLTRGSEAVPVGYVDTGLDTSHFDFMDRPGLTGYDFADNDPDFMDPHGHGTWVAGIYAAHTNNELGIAGIVWNCPLMVMRVAFGLDTIEAIAWATDNGVRVISMSYGSYSGTSWKVAAMQYAFDRGVVLIGAAANDGTNQKFYPAAFETVLAVTGVDWYGDPVGYNWGDWIDISGPAGALTTYRMESSSDGLGLAGGTSIAAPFVAGGAGLVLSANPDLVPLQVMEILRETAEDVYEPGFDVMTGHGRIDYHAAVVAALETPPPEEDVIPPVAAILTPQANAMLAGVINVIVEASDDQIGQHPATGIISRVDLLLDGVVISGDTAPPHEWAFDTAEFEDGNHQMMAIAYDLAGNSGESNLVPISFHNVSTCTVNGVCEFTENCASCPQDCLAVTGAVCGNSVCETEGGEDCISCPQDCNGKQHGNPANRYCCGDGDGENPVGCDDARCGGNAFCVEHAVAGCCGDSYCEGMEDGYNCAVDCGLPPVCGDEICDPGESCETCSDDCEGKLRGRRSDRFCCGNGVIETPEVDTGICDGNP